MSRVKKVHSATSQVVAGVSYIINADLIVNGEAKENCVTKIWERSWLESQQGGKGGETEVSCPDGHYKKYTHTVAKRSAPGSSRATPYPEATKVINAYLNTLDGGPSFK